ncbi:GNAT family N-acetyltransferase [Acidithiobacillus montserratensis]|uniref:GNAT family N-acetyltransferase n=1 Tax=Acidithiobacillus montserratensis TaxID=2729135 RepID=A0ACD5HG80_9PROT|nr:GNAT family N-acetyltransferase [Acidithiobacillus montserratensis]MBN2680347.1 GNAT family N-acetyltransferase [Acidithiobacillaceae bacterium]MBU2748929.1 GNAT family N-acetyltransferase [Acidithiobacillus montserratensis]
MIPRETGESCGRPVSAVELRYLDHEEDIRASYPLMRQLRPQLDSAQAFVQRWQHQRTQGYRLLALWNGGQPLGLAGFRVQDNLVHGRFVYVDDLVIDASCRSQGHGKRLIDALKAEAKVLGCCKLLLDAAMGNALGHRFYYRQGLLATALRFSMMLT